MYGTRMESGLCLSKIRDQKIMFRELEIQAVAIAKSCEGQKLVFGMCFSCVPIFPE